MNLLTCTASLSRNRCHCLWDLCPTKEKPILSVGITVFCKARGCNLTILVNFSSIANQRRRTPDSIPPERKYICMDRGLFLSIGYIQHWLFPYTSIPSIVDESWKCQNISRTKPELSQTSARNHLMAEVSSSTNFQPQLSCILGVILWLNFSATACQSTLDHQGRISIESDGIENLCKQDLRY